jgi:hypothetical protein
LISNIFKKGLPGYKALQSCNVIRVLGIEVISHENSWWKNSYK